MPPALLAHIVPPPIAEPVLLGLLALLAITIAVEDWRKLEIREIWLLAFIAIAALHALISPLPGTSSVTALLGGGVAGLVTLLVGILMRWRTGHESLGGADVYLAVGGGFLLGIGAIGAWILGFALVAGLGWMLAPGLAGLRPLALQKAPGTPSPDRDPSRPDETDDGPGDGPDDGPDGAQTLVTVMPLCPAILLTGGALFLALRLGWLDPMDPLGLRFWIG